MYKTERVIKRNVTINYIYVVPVDLTSKVSKAKFLYFGFSSSPRPHLYSNIQSTNPHNIVPETSSMQAEKNGMETFVWHNNNPSLKPKTYTS